MFKKIRFMFLMAVLGLAWSVAPAAAQFQLAGMGEPINPHGFPSYYEDTTGLALEPCLPPPAGYAVQGGGDGTADNAGMCVYDDLAFDSDLIVNGEIFYWYATSRIILDGGGRAELTLGIEGTFGGAEEVIDGQQITFARTRVRVDTPFAGTYTVTHPYGSLVFEVADPAEGINYTADLGAADFRDPARGFLGTLFGGIDPFLTWPDYENETDLQFILRDEEGTPIIENGDVVILEQYVGDPGVPHVVVGSPTGNNFFRVQGPDGFDVQTDLFSVSGKVFDPNQTRVVHVFPEAPLPKLYGMGPVNRVEAFNPNVPSEATFTGEDLEYPVGYPLWYQENIGTIQAPAPGLRLTLCNPGTLPLPVPLVGTIEAMCISDPIDPTDEAQTTLRTGGEGFWWSADATIDNNGDDFDLILGLEATFGGGEEIVDGGQITFGRERIRIDTNVSGAGTYRVTHPYGVRIFENVLADDRGINFTADIGIAHNPADPLADIDGALIGLIYSDIGPQVLKWTTFNENPALTDQRLVRAHPTIPGLNVYFVGDPAIPMTVTGSPTGTNFFRVEKLADGGSIEAGPWTFLGETNLFEVSGQVYDPAVLGLPPEGVVASSIGVFRNGAWYLDGNGNNSWDGGTDLIHNFGLASDHPVVGDWDGAGSKKIGVFRNGAWYLDADGNGAWNPGTDIVVAAFGQTGDIPVVGNWNGEAGDMIGVFRNGTWYLDSDASRAWSPGVDAVLVFGQAGDIPVVGDWSGDGVDQIGVFRNGTWYLDADGSGTWTPGVDAVLVFGQAGDIPVVGDWNGDGVDQIGVFRNGTWYLDTDDSGTWTPGVDAVLVFGQAGDRPITGKW